MTTELPKAMDIPGRGTVELANVSQSYGGTIYGTTPGGTRIVYTRDMLMNVRFCPQAKTPPSTMPDIPGVTKGTVPLKEDLADDGDDDDHHSDSDGGADGDVFHMENV
eukprot:TRINITY_DN471_c0_g1_i1.p3 TRINITY_DN471_c0_g1~~TRINITY_DN471_c0_g1_i1.p3  ORF type:complete len:108 (+),score=19.99 TRINITY_DN471_c0_g1_i1:50-373(+)